MSLTLITPPAVEPLVLSTARARLRVPDNSQDGQIKLWIQIARERVERETGRALLSQTWLERRDSWWGDGRLTAFGTRFRLLKPPLTALEAVTIYGADDTPSEIDPAAFFVDTLSDPGRLVLRPGYEFPEPARAAGGIEIRYRAGYGDSPDDIPSPLVEAVTRLVEAMYAGGSGTDALTPEVESLLAPWRRRSL